MKIFKLTAMLIASIWISTFLSGFVSGKWELALMITELIVFVIIGYMLVIEIFDNY